MKILGLIAVMVLACPALAEGGNIERIQTSVSTSNCDNLRTQEVEVREFDIRGDQKNFTRRHEHIAICETSLRGMPDVSPVIVKKEYGAFHILEINGSRVRFALARKCFARETLSKADRGAVDPTLEESTKIAQAECLARAKQILESNNEIAFDFEYQVAE
jgi:hypothetical protein